MITSIYAVLAPGKPPPPIVGKIGGIVADADAIDAKRQAAIDALDKQFEGLLRLNAQLAKAAQSLETPDPAKP